MVLRDVTSPMADRIRRAGRLALGRLNAMTERDEHDVALLALFSILMSAKVVLFRLFVVRHSRDFTGLLFDLAFIGLFLLLVDGVFARVRYRALVFLDAVLTFAMIVFVVYFRFYGQLPTPETIFMVGRVTAADKSIASLMRPVYLLFVLDLVLLVPAGIAFERWGTGRDKSRAVTPARRMLYAVMVPFALVYAFGVNAVLGMPLPVDCMAASASRGAFSYLGASFVPRQDTTFSRLDFGDPEDVQRAIDALKSHENVPRQAGFERGAYAGKNLIIIQVEALQQVVIGREVGGEEITPNLNRLIKRSWYFPNTISEVGRGTTADAEFIVNTSLYPSQKAPSTLMYSGKELPSLPRLVRAEGYDAFTFHTNDITFWNRDHLYPALGFTRFYERGFFEQTDTIGYAASDEVLFKGTLDELEKRNGQGTPFYAHIITMSSHHPFAEIPEEKLTLPLTEPYEGTLVGNYLTAIRYADEQIGTFVQGLQRTGLWEDSVVIIYGDHFGMSETQQIGSEGRAQQELLGREYLDIDRMNVPLIIHLPDQSKGVTVQDVAGQIDILPTAADLLGLDLSGTPHFGKSLFDGGTEVMPAGGFMPTGSYVYKDILYVPGVTFEDGEVRDIRTRQLRSIELADKDTWRSMRKLIMLSEDYIQSLPDVSRR